jgi:hypothetical protein
MDLMDGMFKNFLDAPLRAYPNNPLNATLDDKMIIGMLEV